jgi:SAM-dependent methyltransferase
MVVTSTLPTRDPESAWRDKDHAAEAAHAADLVRRHVSEPRRVLELGCGSGMHAAALAHLGLEVLGVDRNRAALDRAEERRRALPPDETHRLLFLEGDVRELALGRRFDAVLAFSFLSTQTTNDDVTGFFRAASRHLAPGGVLLFDFWYGPAVLVERPTARVRRSESDGVRVTRIAEPTIRHADNVVEVRHEVLVECPADGTVARTDESHAARYFTLPELAMFLTVNGLTPVAWTEWMTEREPRLESWSVAGLARK